MLKFNRFDITASVVSVVLIAVIGITVVFVQPPSPSQRVLFLGPADGSPHNIYLVDTASPGAVRQITNSDDGVFDYDPSPDGRYVAYAERSRETGVAEIMLHDLANGSTRRLTNCEGEDASCTTPTWRADGQVIAYQRQERNTALGIGISPPRIWLLDLTSDPPVTFPLFEDSQTLGTEQTWSGDGSTIAFYDAFSQGIITYNFNATDDQERVRFIPAGTGTVGSLSPRGDRLVFSQLILPSENTMARSVLNLADLNAGQFRVLAPEDELVDDGGADWHPDGQQIAVTRQFMDDRFTLGRQVFLVRADTGDATPLIFDAGYANSAISWDSDGTHLLIQRLPMPAGNSMPGIWSYDMDTGELRLLAENGFLPRWVQ
jgi:Tol biopolymer transport system component